MRPIRALLLGCALALVAALAGTPLASAATITPVGPLTLVATSDTLNCAVFHDGPGEDPSAFSYTHRDGPFSCGTFLYDGAKLFGPATGPGFPTRTTFLEQGSQTKGGSGTLSDPWTITTVVKTDNTEGLRLTQVDSYVEGQESVRTDITVRNLGSGTANAVLFRAGDCFKAADSSGSGDASSGAVACVGPEGRSASELVEFFPTGSGSKYIEGLYSSVFLAVGLGQPFANTCACVLQDSAMGLSWSLTLAAQESATRSFYTTYAPTGKKPLVLTKTAAATSSTTGGLNGYTITVTNPNAADVVLKSVTDVLPNGFSYKSGSTIGATTENPTVSGQTLVWDERISVPAGGAISFSFDVTTSDATGVYKNAASATTLAGYPVTPSGPTAPIEVVPAPVGEPVLGREVVGGTESGTVTIRTPDGKVFNLGAGGQIPVGSTVDTRKGTLRMVAANDKKGGKANALFYGGVFTVGQKTKPVRTILRLRQSIGLSSCPKIRKKAKTSDAVASAKRKKRRFLWGSGKGRFQTSGNYGAAVVRGTKWYVEDTCAGTLVKVTRGIVEVQDFGRHRTVRVKAVGRYLARRTK